MKFRKKPVVIDAVQWTGGNRQELCEFLSVISSSLNDYLRTLTPYIELGYWIVRDNFGIHALPANVFAATYEAIPSSALPWIDSHRGARRSR